MAESFMSVMTQIGDLVQKKVQIIKKTGSLLSEAIVDRAKNGKLSASTKVDILNSIKDFSKEEQIEILTEALILVGQNSKSSGRSRDDEDTYTSPRRGGRSSIFGGKY